MARILLADDDRAILSYLGPGLRDHGHELVLCGDGRQALAALAREGFDLVISDIVMPNVDGLELVRTLRDTGIPVLAISTDDASARISYLRTALLLGAAGILNKPFTLDALAEKIAMLLAPKMRIERTLRTSTVAENAALEAPLGNGADRRETEAEFLAYLRTRAEQCRRLAVAARSTVVAGNLEEMAEGYERQARERG